MPPISFLTLGSCAQVCGHGTVSPGARLPRSPRYHICGIHLRSARLPGISAKQPRSQAMNRKVLWNGGSCIITEWESGRGGTTLIRNRNVSTTAALGLEAVRCFCVLSPEQSTLSKEDSLLLIWIYNDKISQRSDRYANITNFGSLANESYFKSMGSPMFHRREELDFKPLSWSF